MSGSEKSESRAGAFFDLDGTLTELPSLEMRLFRERRRRRLVKFRNYWAWLIRALQIARRGLGAIRHTNKMYLKDVKVDELAKEIGMRVRFLEDAVDRAEWHARQGHELVIVSGTLEPLARAAGRSLEQELARRGLNVRISVFGTRLEKVGGKWTGRISGKAVYGAKKAEVIRRIARERGLELEKCYAYGDSKLDRWMLQVVGIPAVVNPSRQLRRLAERSGWTVLLWRIGERRDSTQSARRTPSGRNNHIARGLREAIEGMER